MEYVEEGHNTGDKDFTPQVMKMKDAGVDTVIIWTTMRSWQSMPARYTSWDWMCR